MLAVLRGLLRSKAVLAVGLLFIYLGIGSFCTGEQFFSNISCAVPRASSGGGESPRFMFYGDHFEQLYRYSLPMHNFRRGRPLYESGYQYNLDSKREAFSEGWVFFPFSFIHLLLAPLFGDVASFNLIALFSFPLVGGAMFLLVFWLTRSYPASLLSSLILVLLPHRTTFLFSEMVYGVDLMWPPLVVLFFEKSLRSLAPRHIFVFGIFLLLYATSNFQAFYLFSLFSLPYFSVRSFQVFFQADFSVRNKLRFVGLVFVALLPVVSYLLYIRTLLGASGLSKGQDYSAAQFFSPSPINAVQVFSGNEKAVYLGWPLLIVLILLIVVGAVAYFRRVDIKLPKCDANVVILSGLVFVISYLFSFGSNLDAVLNVNIFHWYFDHVPLANCVRTPGRLMCTAGFYFALFFGGIVHLSIAVWNSKKSRKQSFWVWLVTAVMAATIVYDYNYVNPLMVRLEEHNGAYEVIRGTEGVVYAIPTQQEASHHFNSTFLYYAQQYDLRMFIGHSSMYPKEWNSIIHEFLPINSGRFDKEMMERFKARGITHLVAHNTSFEPNVDSFVIARLKQSPYLMLIAEANGVYVFHVDVNATGSQSFDIDRMHDDILSMKQDIGKFHYLDGWYPREAYPNQRPFHWMHGKHANGVLFTGESDFKIIEFAYLCPIQGLKITINDAVVETEAVDLEGGWKKLVIELSKYGEYSFHVEFFTPQIFTSPPDSREFGCMISDVSVR